MRRVGLGLGLAACALVAPRARAEDAPPRTATSPWLDDAAPAPSPSPSPSTAEDPARPERRWHLLAAAMLGMRGDQGGVLDSGFRFVALAGFVMGRINVTFALDHQLGTDNRIPTTANDPATFAEWVGSVRVGHRVSIGPDFWIQTSGGLARVNTRITHLSTMHDVERAALGFDAVATVVWRSGSIASTLVFGLTAIPGEHTLVVDDVSFVMPARIEPWFGLGIGLIW